MSLSSMRPNSPLVPGYTLDRYELLRPIAEGGMASVWIARLHGKRGFEKLVAVKTILPKYAADAAFQEMLLDEARVASRIHHLNVAQILDLGEEQNILYLVAEWIDGDSLFKLHDLVTRQGLSFPPGLLLRILADTCAGLHAAHELRDESDHPLGVVHRDVSPQNILVSAQGIAKLIDFGIAKARNRFARDTNSGIIKGKAHHMSPEQARGLRIDRRADVWAVGTILYWMLSGNVPYDGGSPVRTLGLVASGRRPAALPQGVHPAIRAVVDRALSSPLDARFATAIDLHDAIERAMVAANATATTADVAAFISKHMGERAVARKYAIALAIKAATNWQSLQRALGRPSPSGSFVAAARLDTQRAPPTYAAIITESSATTRPTLPAVVDQHADILAIGTVLSQLLSGEAPSDGGTAAKSLTLSASGKSPVALSENLRPAIRAAVNDALSPQLDARFSAAADLCEAIERAMSAGSAPPTTTDVAAFIGQRPGGRAAAPKDAVVLALEAAAQLRSSRRALQLPSPTSYGIMAAHPNTFEVPPTCEAIVTDSGATTLPHLPAVVDQNADVLAISTIISRLLARRAPYDSGNVMAAELCVAIERAVISANAPPTTTDIAAFIGRSPGEHEAPTKDAIDLALEAAQARSSERALQVPRLSSSSDIPTRPDWATPPAQRAPAGEFGAATPSGLLTAPDKPRSPVVVRRIAFPRTRRGWAFLGLAIGIGAAAVLHAVSVGHAADFKAATGGPTLSGSEAIAAGAAPAAGTSGGMPGMSLESIVSTSTAPPRAPAQRQIPAASPTGSAESAHGL